MSRFRIFCEEKWAIIWLNPRRFGSFTSTLKLNKVGSFQVLRLLENMHLMCNITNCIGYGGSAFGTFHNKTLSQLRYSSIIGTTNDVAVEPSYGTYEMFCVNVINSSTCRCTEIYVYDSVFIDIKSPFCNSNSNLHVSNSICNEAVSVMQMKINMISSLLLSVLISYF